MQIREENGAPLGSAEMMQRSFAASASRQVIEHIDSELSSVDNPPVEPVNRLSSLSSCLFYFCCFSRFRRISIDNNHQPNPL